MGKLCSKSSQTLSSTDLEAENEVSLTSYKSDSDKDYELIEKKFNYLREINFSDYVHSLINFSNENATLEDDYSHISFEHCSKDPFYNEMFPSDLLQSFVENKLLKHKAVYSKAGENEKITAIFKEMLLAANNGLALKLAQNLKNNGKEGDKSTVVKKCHVISYGLLYCVGSNYAKIHFIFNLFKNSENTITMSEEFSEFLLSIFLVASYGMANARNKTSKYEEVGAIDTDRLRTLLDTSELQDCIKLVEVTNKSLFGERLDDKLTYNQFKAKFDKSDTESVGYILVGPGVRFMLKEHNVD